MLFSVQDATDHLEHGHAFVRLYCETNREVEKVSEFRKELDNIVFEAVRCQCADCARGAIQYMSWMLSHYMIGVCGGLTQTGWPDLYTLLLGHLPVAGQAELAGHCSQSVETATL